MTHSLTRRGVCKLAAAGCALAMLPSPSRGMMLASAAPAKSKPGKAKSMFTISLAQWSLHKALFAGEITTNDFARQASDMGFTGIEYVNAFFKDKALDKDYLKGLNTRAREHGVEQLLIMCDGEGDLGHPDDAQRAQTIENHKKWVHAAKSLGCHSIRVNAASSGSYEEQQKLAADGLRRLTEFAEPHRINVIVENHGGLSSNGKWLSGVMKLVDHPMCGTLPDFGNFCLDWSRSDDPEMWYDRYQGVSELMPYAKAVSAKSYAFDGRGDEKRTDYHRMIQIVMDADYHRWIGVEYEGSELTEREGTLKTKALLERVRDEIAARQG